MAGLVCPCCSTISPQGAIFCDNCGFDLRTVASSSGSGAYSKVDCASTSSPMVHCQNCGFENLDDSIYCENCGSKLSVEKVDLEIGEEEKKLASAGLQVPPMEALKETREPELDTFLTSNASQISIEKVTLRGSLFVVKENLSIPFPEGIQSFTIGRDDPASGIFPDINLEPYGAHDAGVGRRHVQITLQDGAFHVEDLESLNGTFLNREMLDPRTPREIQNGDELRLGKMVLIFKLN